MGLFDWFRGRPTPPTATVSFDEAGVRCERPSGLVESVRWSDLRVVLIRTTDAGPAVVDVFWVLVGRDSGCVVPSEAVGTNALLERLQRLPGFDNQAFIDAMTSTENREFVCWHAPL